MLNSITEIHRKGLFRRQASGLLSQEGDRVGQDLVAGIELNAIARVGQDLDHKAFELDEFFLGHFFIDAQVPEKAITALTRRFPLSSVSSCTCTRIITLGFFARAFAHSCSIISNFSVSVSICCINIPLPLPKIQSICLAVSSESEHDRRNDCNCLPFRPLAVTASSRDWRCKPKILVLRHKLNALQQRAPRRLHLRWADRALFILLIVAVPHP